MCTRILVVEDNFITANEIKSRLYNLECTAIETAFSGEEALAKAATFQPNLILMDVRWHRGRCPNSG